jgi:hypothetical protein
MEHHAFSQELDTGMHPAATDLRHFNRLSDCLEGRTRHGGLQSRLAEGQEKRIPSTASHAFKAFA